MENSLGSKSAFEHNVRYPGRREKVQIIRGKPKERVTTYDPRLTKDQDPNGKKG